MIDIQDRAYQILKKMGSMRASDLGWELWGKTTEAPNRGLGSHKQNKFCRPVGKVLLVLRAQGRAQLVRSDTCILWEAKT